MVVVGGKNLGGENARWILWKLRWFGEFAIGGVKYAVALVLRGENDDDRICRECFEVGHRTVCSAQWHAASGNDKCQLIGSDDLLHALCRSEFNDRGLGSLIGKRLSEEVGDLARRQAGHGD